MSGSWQPVIGHLRPGETAAAGAVRELGEETGLRPGNAAWKGFWALEQVPPYLLAATDEIVLSPRFAAEVGAGWSPRLDGEHSAWRWVALANAASSFMWPGQVAACAEVASVIVAGSPAERALRLDPKGVDRGSG